MDLELPPLPFVGREEVADVGLLSDGLLAEEAGTSSRIGELGADKSGFEDSGSEEVGTAGEIGASFFCIVTSPAEARVAKMQTRKINVLTFPTLGPTLRRTEYLL